MHRYHGYHMIVCMMDPDATCLELRMTASSCIQQHLLRSLADTVFNSWSQDACVACVWTWRMSICIMRSIRDIMIWLIWFACRALNLMKAMPLPGPRPAQRGGQRYTSTQAVQTVTVHPADARPAAHLLSSARLITPFIHLPSAALWWVDRIAHWYVNVVRRAIVLRQD